MYDQDIKAMRKQARHHVKIIKEQKPEVAAYYFSGHGLQDAKQNWFMPVDYVAPQEEDENDDLCMSPQVRPCRHIGSECC
jgi:hypothetical protein